MLRRNLFFRAPDEPSTGPAPADSGAPGGAAPSAPAAPAPASSPGDRLQERELMELLGGGGSPPEPPLALPGNGDGGQSGRPGLAPPAQPQPEPPQAAPAQPAPPTPPLPDAAQIQRTLEQRDAMLRAAGIDPATGQRQAQAPSQPQAQQGNEPADPFAWDLEVSDEMTQQFMSPDPTVVKGSLKAMADSLATNLHRTIVQQFVQAVPHLVQQQLQAHSAMQQVHQDFYGTYKELNQPHFYPMVQAVGAQVEREGWLRQGWNTQARDEIARRVKAALQGALPSQPVASPSPPLGGGGARPGVPSRDLQTQSYFDLFDDPQNRRH